MPGSGCMSTVSTVESWIQRESTRKIHHSLVGTVEMQTERRVGRAGQCLHPDVRMHRRRRPGMPGSACMSTVSTVESWIRRESTRAIHHSLAETVEMQTGKRVGRAGQCLHPDVRMH